MNNFRSAILAGGSSGMMRKVPDVSKIQGLGWRANTALMGGTHRACGDYALGIAE